MVRHRYTFRRIHSREGVTTRPVTAIFGVGAALAVAVWLFVAFSVTVSGMGLVLVTSPVTWMVTAAITLGTVAAWVGERLTFTGFFSDARRMRG
jgi:hypothetical protein